MKRFISTIARVAVLLAMTSVLGTCERNPASEEPPENTDQYFVFEPTEQTTATSYYKGEHGEFVTYGHVSTNQVTGSQEYEHTSLRAYGPQGSVTVTKEAGGYFVVFDTKSEAISVAYRVRESSTSSQVEVYVINEQTGQGIVVGDTTVPRIANAAFSNRSSSGGSGIATNSADIGGAICSAIGDLSSGITTAISYGATAAAVFGGAGLVAQAFPAVSVLWAFAGGVALAALESQINIMPDLIFNYVDSKVQESLRNNCPGGYGDRGRNCPWCDLPIVTCIVDLFSSNPSSCCPSGNCGSKPGYVPCSSCGDVHIRTPDGLAYDFQGAGEYLLMASSDGSVVVQSRQEPWFGSDRVTVNTATAMSVAGDRVGVYLGRSPQLVINGTPTPFNGSRIDLPKGGAVFDGEPGYLIRWPNGFVVSVRLESSFIDIGMSKPDGSPLSYRGLLGNMNGDPADDFFARGGQSFTLPVEFAEMYRVFGASWQISQSESLFDYETGKTTATYALPNYPLAPVTVDDLDADVYEAARNACLAAGISDPVILNDCILDVALTGDSDFIKSAEDAPAPDSELDVDYPDGLVGSYYNGYFNDDFSFFARNAPLLTRVDNPIDFRDNPESWELGDVPALADLETYSVVWEGRLIVPASGTYTLYLNSDDASFLFLGDATKNPSTSNATINNGTPHPIQERSVEVNLAAGDHPILIVYGEEERNNIVQFFWSSAQLNIPKQVVTALGRRAGN